MANGLFAYGNLANGSILSGGLWSSGLQLDNLKNRVLAKVARSLNAYTTSTWFIADIGVNKFVQVVALANHNMSLGAKLRVRGSNNPDPTVATLYDSGLTDVWPAVYSTQELDWQSPNWWSGKILETDREGYTWTAVRILPATLKARYWLIEIVDPLNSAGFVQSGRFFIAGAWQPVTNISYGAAIGWETDTEVQRAQSGTEYFNPKTPYRVVRCSVDWMKEEEAMGQAFDMQRRMGVDGEVLFVWDPDDTKQALRRQFLGRFRTLSPIEHPYYNVHKTAFEIKENL